MVKSLGVSLNDESNKNQPFFLEVEPEQLKQIETLAKEAAAIEVKKIWDSSFSEAALSHLNLLQGTPINLSPQKSKNKDENSTNPTIQNTKVENDLPQSTEQGELQTETQRENGELDTDTSNATDPLDDNESAEEPTKVDESADLELDMDTGLDIQDDHAEETNSVPDDILEEQIDPVEPAKRINIETDIHKKWHDTYDEAATPLVRELDDLMLTLIKEQFNSITQLAAESTKNILELSNGFMDENARNAVHDFHKLYNSSSAIDKTASEVNQHVDTVFQAMVEKMKSQGIESLSTEDIHESETETLNRLSLSGIQRRLEMIISLDTGITEKLVPILSSMQFEDSLNQRISHLIDMWNEVLQPVHLPGEEAAKSLFDSLRQLSSKCSSINETADFYECVLHEEPPEVEQPKSGNILDILF